MTEPPTLSHDPAASEDSTLLSEVVPHIDEASGAPHTAHTSDDGAPRALAARVQTLWRISFLLQAILPSALLGGGAYVVFHEDKPWVAVAVALVPWLIAALAAWRLQRRRYDAWRYRVTDDALRLDRGVMVRTESVVPYTRIQHVDTEQGPIERALGLMRVTVHTASGSGASLTVPGLRPDDAAALREQLAQLAGVVEPL